MIVSDLIPLVNIDPADEHAVMVAIMTLTRTHPVTAIEQDMENRSEDGWVQFKVHVEDEQESYIELIRVAAANAETIST